MLDVERCGVGGGVDVERCDTGSGRRWTDEWRDDAIFWGYVIGKSCEGKCIFSGSFVC